MEQNQFSDIKLFNNVSLSDLFKDIYNNRKIKDKLITDCVSDLKPLITNVSDAIQIVPLIHEYLDVGVRNDEQLVKLAAVIQRVANKAEKNNMNDFDSLFSKEEKELLHKDAEQKRLNEKEQFDKLNEKTKKVINDSKTEQI